MIYRGEVKQIRIIHINNTIFAITKIKDMDNQNTEKDSCSAQLLLRNVPCEVIEAINRKKTEILSNNPYRTQVSNSEAIYKLILKG